MFLVNGCAGRQGSSATPGNSAGNASPRRETASASPAGGDDTHGQATPGNAGQVLLMAPKMVSPIWGGRLYTLQQACGAD